MRYRYRFTQLKKRQPEKFNSIINRILLDLTNLEKAVNESNNTDRCHKALQKLFYRYLLKSDSMS